MPKRNLAARGALERHAPQDSDPRLRVQVHRARERVTVVLGGDLDLRTAPELGARLAEIERDAPPVIVIDLRELAFMDSSGLGELILATRRARAGERRVVLVTGSEPIDRVLTISGAVRMLDTTPDLETLDA